jgi:hypothetical protein
MTFSTTWYPEVYRATGVTPSDRPFYFNCKNYVSTNTPSLLRQINSMELGIAREAISYVAIR